MRIQGEGSPDAVLVFIGDAPRLKEEKAGRPFVGSAGRSLTKYLDGRDLPARADCFITNLVRERCLDAEGWHREVTQADIDRDWPELELELNLLDPLVLVPLGPIATRAFLGTVDLHRIHSLSHQCGDYTVILCFDPNALALFTYDMPTSRSSSTAGSSSVGRVEYSPAESPAPGSHMGRLAQEQIVGARHAVSGRRSRNASH
jgi:uracil-DNA glycosylase family 4